MWLNKGYMHLLNNYTSTLTTSNKRLSFIDCGAFLSKNIEKVYGNHDRRPGKLVEGSPIKELVEEYQCDRTKLKELSMEIADLIFKERDNNRMDNRTALFVLEGGDIEGDKLFVLELTRSDKFQIELYTSENQVKNNDMILNNATKKTNFFAIDLTDLTVSLYEPKGEIFENALGLELDLSLNEQLDKARECFYNTITKIENRQTYMFDIQEDGNLEKISLVNAFEGKINVTLSGKRRILFESIAEELFENSRMLKQEFLRRLKNKGVPMTLTALSDAPIPKKQIKEPERLKQVRLKNGIVITIPEGVEELEPIILKNKDGVIQEVENNEEV